jgi:hypothetical protein
MKGDPVESNIKNTFVPNCDNDTFSINNLVFMLRQGFVKNRMIPEDIMVRIKQEITIRDSTK